MKRLLLHENGIAEFLIDGDTVWASDDDPEVLDEIGTDALTEEDIPDVLDYLVDADFLTSEEADAIYDRDFPEMPSGPGDEEDDDDEDEEFFEEDDRVIEGELAE